MDKAMDKLREENRLIRDADRKRLLAVSDKEAYDLPPPDRYQRMRYLREIEAYEYIKKLHSTQPIPMMKKTYVEYRVD